MEYTFKNTKTGKIVTFDLKMSEYDEFKVSNPHLERYHDTAPSFQLGKRATSSLSTHADSTWKEVLSKVAEKHPASPLAEQHRKKTIKEVKTREVFDKHLKKQRKQQ